MILTCRKTGFLQAKAFWSTHSLPIPEQAPNMHGMLARQLNQRAAPEFVPRVYSFANIIKSHQTFVPPA